MLDTPLAFSILINVFLYIIIAALTYRISMQIQDDNEPTMTPMIESDYRKMCILFALVWPIALMFVLLASDEETIE